MNNDRQQEITETPKQKKTNFGLRWAQPEPSIRHQPIYLKVFRPEPS